MRAIILAAGIGWRLGGADGQGPKSLIRFDGRSLLDRHLEALRAGGLSSVSIGVGYQAEHIEADELARIASLSPVPWSQRLGYLLEAVGSIEVAEPLAAHVARVAKEYVPLNPGVALPAWSRSRRWKLDINAAVEPEA